MATNEILHAGVIDSITEGCVHVRIVQASACASCKMAAHCTSSESKEKIIDVRLRDVSEYSVGDDVTVVASSSMGMRAVLLAFVIPTVVLVGTIAVALFVLETSEAVAALSGMVAMVPYYTLLYMCRGALERTMKFDLLKN